MKTLIFGTTNLAKINQVKGSLVGVDIDVLGLPSDVEYPHIEENGATVEENARIKALAYAKLLGKPVLSMDNALYIDKVPAEDQPGVNVRRIPGHKERPTDEELIKYYQALFESLGGTTGKWVFACCVAGPSGVIAETTIESPRKFISKPSRVVLTGFPLDSLQIDPESDQYISEMDPAVRAEFRKKSFGDKFKKFIISIVNRI